MWLRAFLTATLTSSVALAADCTEDAMIVFDGSGSMSEVGFNQLDEPRIFEARRAVARAIPEIALHRRIGLVVYGPGGGDSCTGIDLRFAPRADAAQAIISAIDTLEPDGATALADAVKIAAETLDYKAKAGAVVLVTDGKETCFGAPCQLAAELAATGRDLTVHVIGFKVRGDFFAWQSQGESDYSDADTPARCLADRTGGKYVTAETVDELTAAFRETLGCALLF
ncbi:vWA domain-containing protein [Jannaschia aquimarina]|uniref:von Willebrand factor type A domain protein n=1 Tax=Jannaschia aquimarina TaxID=935700 RepID=A0A0D1EBY0_9RHOB|nr:VWA domain-containing protein [Jannaschia aquimarina]KIT14371.1 von Willebrand factor type A domain protein [Jannaschia aquimarina]SNS87190.1 Ca-activated chloride channel family protein [Jannaschia aquimarina]